MPVLRWSVFSEENLLQLQFKVVWTLHYNTLSYRSHSHTLERGKSERDEKRKLNQLICEHRHLGPQIKNSPHWTLNPPTQIASKLYTSKLPFNYVSIYIIIYTYIYMYVGSKRTASENEDRRASEQDHLNSTYFIQIAMWHKIMSL